VSPPDAVPLHDGPGPVTNDDDPDAPSPAAGADPRVTVLVITRERRDELLHTLDRLAELPERPGRSWSTTAHATAPPRPYAATIPA